MNKILVEVSVGELLDKISILEINNHTGSKIKEIKEYTSYWKLYFFSKYFMRLWIKKVINR